MPAGAVYVDYEGIGRIAALLRTVPHPASRLLPANGADRT